MLFMLYLCFFYVITIIHLWHTLVLLIFFLNLAGMLLVCCGYVVDLFNLIIQNSKGVVLEFFLCLALVVPSFSPCYISSLFVSNLGFLGIIYLSNQVCLYLVLIICFYSPCSSPLWSPPGVSVSFLILLSGIHSFSAFCCKFVLYFIIQGSTFPPVFLWLSPLQNPSKNPLLLWI